MSTRRGVPTLRPIPDEGISERPVPRAPRPQGTPTIWLEHPAIRVRIDESIFELLAIRATDERLRAAVLTFRGYDPVPEGIVLFRFDPR